MMKITFLGLTAAAGLTAVAAASMPRADLSIFCPHRKLGINCIAPGAFNDVLSQVAKNASLDVVVASINNWLTGMCSVGFYVHPSVAAAQLIQSHGVQPPDIGACRNELFGGLGANTKFCMTELLTKDSAITQLSLADPTVLLQDFTFGVFNLDCDECTKATFQLLATLSGGKSSTALITAVCGANFTATLNTTAPVGITHSAVNVELGNGAAVLAPTAALLILVGLFFTLL
ncbi:hypothetical protein DFH09DRAFT_1099973 [Mycena vulgaris]|nr:hypothetical protein DFH09DRAFT_1099973 [Mycena vulgaris]